MTRSRLPWVFRISAGLIVGAVMVGTWWQPQAAGPHGRAFLATVARACPAAVVRKKRPTVADTAHALDRWAYLAAVDLVRGGTGRCAAGAAR